ncbi:MAG: TetR/AcrR family transcriptional regulator [Gemmatimonadota bacterium]|nr:TetR/AcrR family transcriptional regulator [Gemmatimonadota bacterium]
MSPRPYRLGRRQEAADETRARIITAARELLSASGRVSGFTIDGVAEQAGVARMTVYHKFGSKQGLLEALFDVLAATGGMSQMPAVFQRKDPLEAIDAYVATLARFWTAHRLVHRRVHGLAAIDPELEPAWRTRQGWRREGLTVLVRRLAKQFGRPRGAAIAEAVDVLFTLTSFPAFDVLAGEARTPEDVAPIVQRLARSALGVGGR